MTKAEFNKSVESTKCGGDCWNDFYVLRKAFELSGVEAVLSIHKTGTGLYCDVTVLVNGAAAPQVRRVFG